MPSTVLRHVTETFAVTVGALFRRHHIDADEWLLQVGLCAAGAP